MVVPLVAISLLASPPDRLYVSVGSGAPSKISQSVVAFVSDSNSNKLIRKDINDRVTVFYDPDDEGLVGFRESTKLFEEIAKGLSKNVVSTATFSESSKRGIATIMNSMGELDLSQPGSVILHPSLRLDFGQYGAHARIEARVSADWEVPTRVNSWTSGDRPSNPVLKWKPVPRFVFRSQNGLSAKEMGARMGLALEVYEQALMEERKRANAALAKLTALVFEVAGLGSLHRSTSRAVSLSQISAQDRSTLIQNVRKNHRELGFSTADEAEQSFLSKKAFSLTPRLGFGMYLEHSTGQSGFSTMVYEMPCLNSGKRP